MYQLPELLKAKRTEMKLSQPTMAERLGVHYRTYQAWERDMTIPKEENCGAIANILEVPIYELEKEVEKEKLSRRKPYGSKNH